MLFVDLQRVLKSGLTNFWRNGWLSFATTIVMVLALFIMGTILTIDFVFNSALKNIEEKVDISVYLKQETKEDEIATIKSKIENLPEVKNIEYISRDEAWAKFQERHKTSVAISASIKELNENPLYATFNIKTHELNQFAGIINILKQDEYKNAINKINYDENKSQIDKLSEIISSIQKGGAAITLIFLIVSILITFNAIRLTIYSHQQEIEIMRLVGASNWYIKAPFVIEGIIYGLIGSLISLGVFYPLIYFASGQINGYLPDINILNYFQTNFSIIFSVQLLAGITVGIISSLIAIRRYLRV